MEPRIVLFEDHLLADMAPVSLTRPVFDVTCACYTLREVICSAAELPGAQVHWVVRDYLSKITARAWPQAPVEPGGMLFFLNASVVPDVRYAARIRELWDAGAPFIATAGRRVSAALVPAGSSMPDRLTAENVTPWLLEMKLPLHDEELFRTFDHQFEVVKYIDPLFDANIEHRVSTGGYREVEPRRLRARGGHHRGHCRAAHAGRSRGAGEGRGDR